MKPITFYCTDDGMLPVTRCLADYAKQYVVGKYYALAEVIERSRESHNLYFACVALAFENSQKGEAFADANQYRQYCLIKVGCHHLTSQMFSTEQDAISAVALSNKRSGGDYTHYEVKGRVVFAYQARTQKLKKNDPDGMDKKDFEASKNAVLEFCAADLGISVEQLVEEAKRTMVRQRPLKQKEKASGNDLPAEPS